MKTLKMILTALIGLLIGMTAVSLQMDDVWRIYLPIVLFLLFFRALLSEVK